MARSVLLAALLMILSPFARADGDAEWLRGLGAAVTEAGGAVSKVGFKDCSKVGEPELRRLGQIKSLKSLTLYGKCAALTDQTLPLVLAETAAGLEEFNAEGAQISDDGLKALASLSNVKSMAFFHLSLQLKGFTGRGFANLASLPKLERLTVAGSPFNDEGMAAIGQLTQLREFRTWHTYQTAAGNAALAKLTNLRSVHLGQRLRKWDGSPNPLSLTDDTLEVLGKIPSLESVSIAETRLTLAGLNHLASLPQLKTLTLDKIEVSAEDVEAFKKAHPNVAVKWAPLEAEEKTKLEGLLKP